MSTRLRLFPLNTVLFPGALLNLHVFETRYKQLLADCMENGEGFGVVLLRGGREAGDSSVEPHAVGTVAQIGEVTQLPFGRYYVSTVGTQRFRIREILSREPYLTVEAEFISEEDAAQSSEIETLASQVRTAFDEYLRLIVDFSGAMPSVELPQDAVGTSFSVGDALQVADAMKQRLLELSSTRQRLSVELGFLRRLLPQLRRLLERKKEQLASAPARPQDDASRNSQERYYGKYFSSN